MKLASTHWMRQEPLARTVARLADTGYDGIVIDGNLARLRAANVDALLQHYGIACHGVLPIMQSPYDLIDPDEDVRRATIDYLCALIRVSADLGAELLSLAPYREGRLTPRSAPEQEWAWSVDSLKRVAELALELGITVGIEPVNRYETNMLNRHDQAISLVQAVGPGTGVILDTFHMNIEERDICDAITATGPWLVEMQFADSNRLAPGRGHLDWPAILRALDRVGFDGYLTAEMHSPEDRLPTAWSARSDLASLLTESPNEAPFLHEADGFPLSDADYTASLREAARFLRAQLEQTERQGPTPVP
jgi:sugar phosphate isomerase/epimerase